MISYEKFLMGRDKEYPPTEQMKKDAKVLLWRVRAFFMDLGISLHDDDLSSGYRPGKYNVAAGGAPKSAHLMCQAVDLKDAHKKIKEVIGKLPRGGRDLLEKHGLWMENPAKTPTWVHLDIKDRPGRKDRIFG